MTTYQGATNNALNQRAWPTRARAETSSARLALYVEKTAGEEEHPPLVDKEDGAPDGRSRAPSLVTSIVG